MDEILSIDNLQKIKLGVHIAQALFIFISWCIMIAVFRTAFLSTSSPIWYFILCFLTIPALIYQTLTPRFERSRKWGNPYAFAAIDVVYTVFWLSAWASVAAWNSTNLCSPGCNLSKAVVGLGFFIFLFFGICAAMSVYGVIYFRKNGSLPGGSRIPTNASMIDPHRDAFSTAPHDDEYGAVNDRDDSHLHEVDGAGASGLYDPERYDATGESDYRQPIASDTSYRAYGEEPPVHMGGYGDEPPVHTGEYGDEPPVHMGGYDGVDERVQFPAGNYH